VHGLPGAEHESSDRRMDLLHPFRWKAKGSKYFDSGIVRRPPCIKGVASLESGPTDRRTHSGNSAVSAVGLVDQAEYSTLVYGIASLKKCSMLMQSSKYEFEPMASDARNLSKVVSAGMERMCADFTRCVQVHGFSRTKKWFWTRLTPLAVEFVHLHRSGSSYGSAVLNGSVSIRVHCGIRALHDPFEAVALNGPQSGPEIERSGRFHFRFNANSNSTYDRCLADLARYVSEQCVPWFHKFSDPHVLLTANDTPLSTEARNGLRDAIAARGNDKVEAASLKLLGVQMARRQ